jgi:hypothetical protein
MWRSVLAVVVAVIVGGIATFFAQIPAYMLHPLPPDIDVFKPESAELLKVHATKAPAAAMLAVVASHAVGAFVAGLLAALIAKTNKLRAALIAGAILLLFGMLNIISIPSPLWFVAFDLLIYLPAA